MNASAPRRPPAKAASGGTPRGRRSRTTRASAGGSRRPAQRSRAKRVGAGIRRRGAIIAISVTGVIAAMLVTGVVVAAPLGDAIGQAVNGALSSAEKNKAQDAPQTIIVPPQSAAMSQPGDTPGALPGLPGLADQAWATRISTETNISVRAIQAYAGVAIAKEAENPGCHLGWNTLAAIGSVESGNGTHGGSSVGANGVVSPPIYGPALDGNGFNAVPDSDAGAIDADRTGDRAVGPMQMIPQAWRNWGTDGNGDGIVDPQNIDDATLATANYLCHAGVDLSTDAGWKKAVAAYNDAGSYALKVSQAADRFATATAT